MDEGAHFTMDFVEEQYRQQIKMLMEILCIDLKEAYQLFITSGCNVQAAINQKTNSIPPQHHSQHPAPRNNRTRNGRANQNYQQEIHNLQHFGFDDDEEYHSLPVARKRKLPDRVPQQNEFDSKFNKLLEHKRKKNSFEKNYKIRRQVTEGPTVSMGMKIFEKKPKKKQQKKLLNINPYFKEIQKGLLKQISRIKFGKGSMSESIQKCNQTYSPLLAYHIAFDKQEEPQKCNPKMKKQTKKNKKTIIDITDDNPSQNLVQQSDHQNQSKFLKTQKNKFFKSLLTNSMFVRVTNQGFLNYIVDTQNYEYEAYLRQFFPTTSTNQSYLSILRVNIFNQIQCVGTVNLDQIIKTLKQNDTKQTQQAISKTIQQVRRLYHKVKELQKQQDQLAQRYNYFQQGILHYDYVKPITNSQKKKIKEDRQIIKQQQQEFLNMENQIIQQKIKQLGNDQQNNKITKQEILEKRQAVRQALTKYDQGGDNVMMIKFRLPSSKNIIVNVSMKEKISYLFDYIFSSEIENMGFEDEQNGEMSERNFQIIRPQDRLSLQKVMEKSLQQVFEGSTMQSLIVKEK